VAHRFLSWRHTFRAQPNSSGAGLTARPTSMPAACRGKGSRAKATFLPCPASPNISIQRTTAASRGHKTVHLVMICRSERVPRAPEPNVSGTISIRAVWAAPCRTSPHSRCTRARPRPVLRQGARCESTQLRPTPAQSRRPWAQGSLRRLRATPWPVQSCLCRRSSRSE